MLLDIVIWTLNRLDNEGNFVDCVASFESTELYLPSEDGGTYGRYIATEKRDWIGLKISSFHQINIRSPTLSPSLFFFLFTFHSHHSHRHGVQEIPEEIT
jgi:hypothetical protein